MLATNAGSLGLLVGLVGVDHELEAPDPVRDRDRRVRPLGIGADLAVGVAQRIVGEVDDQPARRRRGALEGHAHQTPGGAAPTVAADDVAAPAPVVPSPQLDGDTVGVLGASTSSGGPTAPRLRRIGPAREAIRHRPSAGRSRCAWASRTARRAAPSRRAAAAWRRRTAGSGWAPCAAGRARPARSTGRCAATRRRARHRADSRSGCRAPRRPASRTPCRPRTLARVRPTGPAPTIRTSTSLGSCRPARSVTRPSRKSSAGG